MIGTGTGIAPFFGMLEDKKHNPKSNFKNLTLVFGFRKWDIDFINKELILQYQKQKVLDEFYPVCSR